MHYDFFFIMLLLASALAVFLIAALIQKLRRKAHELVRIAIKEFDEKGCLGEDGRFIPWQDVRAIVKEEPAKATMYGASPGVAIGGGVVVRYRLVVEGINPSTQYILLYISRAWFYFGDTEKIMTNRDRFYGKVKRFLEIASKFQHIQFESYNRSGRDAEATLALEMNWVSSQTGPAYFEKFKKNQNKKDAIFVISLIIFLLIAVPLMFFLYKYLVE